MFVLPLSRSAHRAITPNFGRAMDRLFDESFDRCLSGTAASSTTRTPALDVSETDTAYTAVFDVPGVTREQLKVSVEGRRVSIETVEAEIVLPAYLGLPDPRPVDKQATQISAPIGATRS